MSVTPERQGPSDDDLNPHRAEDQARVAGEIQHNLRQRGVNVRYEETGMELVELLESVEKFERARSALGGDSMTNSPDSSKPERKEFVLPKRGDDESIADYTVKIKLATDGLGAAE